MVIVNKFKFNHLTVQYFVWKYTLRNNRSIEFDNF